MEFFKLVGIVLVVPFLTAFLYFVLLIEKVGQLYGINMAIAATILTIVLPGMGFLKDFWSGAIVFSIVILCWVMVAPKIL